MKVISLLVLLVVGLLAKQSTLAAPTPAPTQGPPPVKTTLITIIAKAEIQATYIAENAFAIADARETNQTENVTYSCFIEPRDLHPSNPPPLQRLASDRDWLVQFLNYTKAVYEADCPTFPPADRTCFNINYTITNIMNLKALLDKIIPANKTEGAASEAMGSGEETQTPSVPPASYCNSTSHAQQHWNFSTLGTLADLFIKEDLKALAATITI